MGYFVVNAIKYWEMLKEEFGVLGDIIKVSKAFVQ